MAPIQRAGMEYEFTVVGDMDTNHTLTIGKSRCDLIADSVVTKPGQEFFRSVLDWLNSGVDVPAPAPKTPTSMTLEEARTCVTPGGKLFGDLTPDQLRQITGIMEAKPSPTTNDLRAKLAAEMVLDAMSAETPF
jgi:hypothetical protein